VVAVGAAAQAPPVTVVVVVTGFAHGVQAAAAQLHADLVQQLVQGRRPPAERHPWAPEAPRDLDLDLDLRAPGARTCMLHHTHAAFRETSKCVYFVYMI